MAMRLASASRAAATTWTKTTSRSSGLAIWRMKGGDPLRQARAVEWHQPPLNITDPTYVRYRDYRGK
jgi:hypothetical protein